MYSNTSRLYLQLQVAPAFVHYNNKLFASFTRVRERERASRSFQSQNRAFFLIHNVLDICLFVCRVICFLAQNETSKLFPEVVSILAAYLRNTLLGDPYHPSPATITSCDQFTREKGGVFKE